MIVLLSSGSGLAAQAAISGAGRLELDSPAGLEPINAHLEPVMYRGRAALRLVANDGAEGQGLAMALVPGLDFGAGTIEVDVAGAPLLDAPEGARGFIGLAFHVQPHAARFKMFYLRPTNGRSDDQLRRNHSVQYVAEPDYPWDRLRKEEPGVYESYADIEPGVWTRVRIVVTVRRAMLYVNEAPQPSLIINDLKLEDQSGKVALWIGPGTDGYFSRLRWSP